jgi:carotenoid cleavage dioxygenase
MIAPHVMGQKNRFAYLQAIPHEIPATFDALLKVDIHTGKTERYDYGPGVYGSEAPFAARPGATEEDDGYLMTFVTDTADWSSRCLVFDAKCISDGPVATVHIPFRVPAGFHATWMDASEWA